MRTAKELLVTGSVQGIGFRWRSKRIADELGVDGWVRNNPDGSVSLAIEGEEAVLNDYVERLGEALGYYITDVRTTEIKPGKNREGFDVVH